MGLCDVKSWARYVMEEFIRFSPTSEIDGMGAQHIYKAGAALTY
jgi:hypothetical protein